MSYPTLKANNVTLPSPIEIQVSNEIIWSANTGRSSNGKMIGDVVAKKDTITLKWGVLTGTEYKTLKNNIKSGFHPFTLNVPGGESLTITSYRGNLAADLLQAGGETFYKDANVTIIQQ